MLRTNITVYIVRKENIVVLGMFNNFKFLREIQNEMKSSQKQNNQHCSE